MEQNNADASKEGPLRAAPTGVSVYDWQLIETYDGDSYGIFRGRGTWAFGRQDGEVFYEIADGNRTPLDWKPEMWAPVSDEQIGAFAFS